MMYQQEREETIESWQIQWIYVFAKSSQLIYQNFLQTMSGFVRVILNKQF